MTPIRPYTAKRLGLRKPLTAKVIELAEAVGRPLEPWQKWTLLAYFRDRQHG